VKVLTAENVPENFNDWFKNRNFVDILTVKGNHINHIEPSLTMVVLYIYLK